MRIDAAGTGGATLVRSIGNGEREIRAPGGAERIAEIICGIVLLGESLRMAMAAEDRSAARTSAPPQRSPV